MFSRKYFRIWDKETPLTSGSLTVTSTNTTFTNPIQIMTGACGSTDYAAGCPMDGGYYIDFPQPPGNSTNPSATVKVKVTDGTLDATSSFTLRKDSASNPPMIGGVPHETIQKTSTNFKYGPTWFVVGDLDSAGADDAVDSLGSSRITFDQSSDNTLLVPNSGIEVLPLPGARSFEVTVSPNSTALLPDRATITITAIDPDGNKTSTSFVLDVIPSTNTPPSFTPPPLSQNPHPTWLERDVTQSASPYQFKVTDTETPKNELLVTATSSNASLVPNDSTHLAISSISSGGNGSITITPLPLPSPSPGVPQSATITLSVTDSAYTRRTQFLYVAKNPNSRAVSFSRPTGVYLLDPDDPAKQRPDDPFLTGEMHRLAWADIDNGDPNPANWNWDVLDDVVADLPAGQDLSLFLAVEPCDIATNSATQYTWCDTVSQGELETCPHNCGPGNNGVLRATPWDPYLQQRRNKFFQELAKHVIPSTWRKVANEPLIPIINPNLPGGDAGIRELDGTVIDATRFPGYTREAFLGAIQSELDTVLKNFPGKFVQIGFFTVEDNVDSQFDDESLWHWLYNKLAIGTFDGRRKPRVHFFQEDLASTRASAEPTYIPYVPAPNTVAYSFTPNHCQVPAFAYNCGDDTDTCDPATPCAPTDQEYNNGIVYQANTPWSAPTGDDKVTKTLNSTPNDGLEADFNAYLGEYLEVYLQDADHAKPLAGDPPAWDWTRWAAGLQSWKDYTGYLRLLAPVESPAGLTVERAGASSNTVSWYGFTAVRPTIYSANRFLQPALGQT